MSFLNVGRPTLKIYLFPLTPPCFTGMGWLKQDQATQAVNYFFNFSNWIPIKLNCMYTVKPVLRGHSTKDKKVVCFFKTDYRIMQVKSIAECSQVKSIAKCSLGAFCNTFDLHLEPICLNDLCCVYLFLDWLF